MKPFILQPNTYLQLRMFDDHMVEHIFATRFIEPTTCVKATAWVMMAVIDRLGPTNDTKYEESISIHVHNCLIMLYHKQQEAMLPPEDGPDLLHD